MVRKNVEQLYVELSTLSKKDRLFFQYAFDVPFLMARKYDPAYAAAAMSLKKAQERLESVALEVENKDVYARVCDYVTDVATQIAKNKKQNKKVECSLSKISTLEGYLCENASTLQVLGVTYRKLIASCDVEDQALVAWAYTLPCLVARRFDPTYQISAMDQGTARSELENLANNMHNQKAYRLVRNDVSRMLTALDLPEADQNYKITLAQARAARDYPFQLAREGSALATLSYAWPSESSEADFQRELNELRARRKELEQKAHSGDPAIKRELKRLDEEIRAYVDLDRISR